jgi:hypothetical protein
MPSRARKWRSDVMSVRLVRKYLRAKGIPPTRKLLLLVLADLADTDTTFDLTASVMKILEDRTGLNGDVIVYELARLGAEGFIQKLAPERLYAIYEPHAEGVLRAPRVAS